MPAQKQKEKYLEKNSDGRKDQPGSFGQKESGSSPFFATFLVMFAIWLLLSGRFDLFHLLLGVISCMIVAAFSGDLIFPPESKKVSMSWLRFVRYVPWLLWQVFLANAHVMYLVFHPRMMDLIDPRIIEFQSRLKSDMALVVFANSITLTPGTITVYTSIYGDYTVHVIDKQSGQALPGDMEERVGEVFGE